MPAVLPVVPEAAYDAMPFIPEQLLPSQFEVSASLPAEPERKLALAVLTDALRLVTRKRSESPHGLSAPPIVAEARAWIASDDASWPFAFCAVCETLGLAPQALRARLAQVEKPIASSLKAKVGRPSLGVVNKREVGRLQRARHRAAHRAA